MYYYEANNIARGPIAKNKHVAKRTIANLESYLHKDIYLLDEKMRKIEKYDSEVKCWVLVNES